MNEIEKDTLEDFFKTSSTVWNPFDPKRDYFAELKSSEKYKDDNGREYPYLKGLQRLAHENRGGILKITSKIEKTPSVGVLDENAKPDCIASATVGYHFNDGTSFEASADASYKAHDAPFNLHLVAVAESKAEARAIRKSLNIRQVSKEEIGTESEIDFNIGADENESASDLQLHTLRTVIKRKGVSEEDFCKKLEREKLEDLTHLEARKAMEKANRLKVKKK